ncbi:hypothetical protein LGM58_29550 [Burkholderia contaminans]|uniref:DUF2515 family protein n=1 Tax=Burkholderia contaminans TaxID=488447 RepID=UPI001CF4180F|nr:hypothetical protein [Burkholderia contaminans]MCA7887336.1 hypothetical protein [Burkholderia contaminans]
MRYAVHEGLGKGNLWIYNDLLPWCYGYAADPVMFQDCAKQRDSRKFDPAVQNNLMRQQWAAEVVPKCPVYIEASANMDDAGSGNSIDLKSEKNGHFQWTPRVAIGFDLVKQWEETTNEKKKATFAFNHLWVMAQHEQGEVLQDLIYNDKAFIRRLLVQRISGKLTDPDQWWNYPLHPFNAMIPPLQLSFTAQNETSDMQYRSNAPKDLILEDYPQRMAWIKDTGKLFHFLMQKKREYMLGELKGIAAMGGRT